MTHKFNTFKENVREIKKMVYAYLKNYYHMAEVIHFVKSFA